MQSFEHEPPQFISIHALREEGDPSAYDELGRHPISIHALREEGDKTPQSVVYWG